MYTATKCDKSWRKYKSENGANMDLWIYQRWDQVPTRRKHSRSTIFYLNIRYWVFFMLKWRIYTWIIMRERLFYNFSLYTSTCNVYVPPKIILSQIWKYPSKVTLKSHPPPLFENFFLFFRMIHCSEVRIRRCESSSSCFRRSPTQME
jgi:hypothetical protein